MLATTSAVLFFERAYSGRTTCHERPVTSDQIRPVEKQRSQYCQLGQSTRELCTVPYTSDRTLRSCLINKAHATHVTKY